MSELTLPLNAEQLQTLLDEAPFNQLLGLKVIKADPAREELTVIASVRPEFERLAGTGQWHGGPLASIIDTVGDFALTMLLGRVLPTINFRVDYLRPATTATVKAVARVRRNGRSVGLVDVDLYNDADVLLAVGRVTYATQSGR